MMIPWQTYYHLNKHLPYGKILEGYNRILLEFNEKVAQTVANPGAVVSAGGHIHIEDNGTVVGGVVSGSYSATLQSLGGRTPYSYTLVGGSLPNGISLNGSTGALTGRLLDDGTFNFSIESKDSAGFRNIKQFSVVVTTSTLTLTGTVPNGTLSSSYTASFSTAGGIPPYVYTLVTGSLPTGTTFSGSRISGSFLSAEGEFMFRMKSTDAALQSASVSYTMRVTPIITLSDDISSSISGSVFSAQVLAAGGVPPYVYTLTSGSLPPVTTLSDSTGIISGSLEETGSFEFEITAEDAGGYTGSATFAMDVTES
jgi:hypothetical protein